MNDNLRRALEATPKEHTPDKDLWSGIEQGIIRANQRKQKRPYMSVAAALFVALSLGLLGFYGGQMKQSAEIADRMSRDFNEQKQALLVKYQSSQVTTDNFEQQMQDLDDAAKAIRQALAEDPSNPVLLQMLKRVYKQQISLIESVHETQFQRI